MIFGSFNSPFPDAIHAPRRPRCGNPDAQRAAGAEEDDLVDKERRSLPSEVREGELTSQLVISRYSGSGIGSCYRGELQHG
jgi:hypothetical protein